MNANIFRFEFRSRLKSVLTWSVSCAAIILIFFSFFTAFADQAELVNDMMANFPPELLTAFGMTGLDLSTVLGFYAFIFIFVQLCLAIQAANYGTGLVSVEENERTADFLLTRPVGRRQVLTSKLLAAVASLAVTNAVVWVVTFLAIEIGRGARTYEPQALLLLLGSIALFQLFFLSVGLLISLLVKRVHSVTPYGLGLGFGAYTLNAFSGVFGDVKLEYITPFKHFDAHVIATKGALNTPLVLLSVAVSLVSLAVSYWLYLRRDIPAVS